MESEEAWTGWTCWACGRTDGCIVVECQDGCGIEVFRCGRCGVPIDLFAQGWERL